MACPKILRDRFESTTLWLVVTFVPYSPSIASTCVSVAVLLHYLFLASFLWMLLEGVCLYVLIVDVFSTIKVWYLYVFAWGFPIIPVVISLGISAKDGGVLQNYTNPNFCWLSFSNKLSWSFIAPVLIVTPVNVIILIAVLREMRNLKDPNKTRLKSFKYFLSVKGRKELKACIILAPLLGLTWVFGLLTATDAGLVFQYIFTILNSTQGFFIFVFLVVLSKETRTALETIKRRWETTRSASMAKEESSLAKEKLNQRKDRTTRSTNKISPSTPDNFNLPPVILNK
ncbi:PREDICTED: adhesion G-protein coupled receptor D1-like [Acropora digitifera]|uniref:adhesion G-protein coupled receptor D1-like n=1 Tax=Acropora digitifera TaxID=70779 RepID=UPI00077AEA2B|nr:PREDICTED: adhesion G-protein coupled receptor D1-like [Acropora digitifera]